MHPPHDDDWCPTRRRFVTGAAATGLLLPLPVWAADPSAAGRVADLKGEAHAEQPNNRRTLALNANVLIGDLVSTAAASRLGVELGPRTRIRLGENARLRIDKYLAGTGGDFNLEAGVLKFDSTAKLKRPDLQFRSAYGLIAVRGTRFYMGPLDGRFAILVGSGSVAVTAGGATVVLKPGQGTDIAAPGERPGPVRTWPYARVRRMLRAVE